MKGTWIRITFILAVITASVAPIGLAAQEARSPAAPRREVVEPVVREAYEKFKSVKAQKVIEYVARKLNYNLFSPSSVGLK